MVTYSRIFIQMIWQRVNPMSLSEYTPIKNNCEQRMLNYTNVKKIKMNEFIDAIQKADIKFIEL